MDEQFLSPIEVAEILQVKKNTVYEMIKRGDLKATKMGKQFRIARNDLYEYMGISPEAESAENIVICGQDQLLDVLCSLYNEQSDGKTQVYRSPMAATADCTGCIRMKIMWQPVICGMAKQIRIIFLILNVCCRENRWQFFIC